MFFRDCIRTHACAFALSRFKILIPLEAGCNIIVKILSYVSFFYFPEYGSRKRQISAGKRHLELVQSCAVTYFNQFGDTIFEYVIFPRHVGECNSYRYKLLLI